MATHTYTLVALSGLLVLAFGQQHGPEMLVEMHRHGDATLVSEVASAGQLMRRQTRQPGNPDQSQDPSSGDLEKHFAFMANTHAWKDAESISGDGSNMKATANVRQCLGAWIQKYNIKIFMDIPSGDGNWQGQIPGIDGITYLGYDIAEEAVERAKTKNKEHAHMQFGQLDLVHNVPPGNPDIVMMRDVIQHLPLKAGLAMLQNAKKSGAKYLAVTTYNDKPSNAEMNSWHWYQNNIHAAPFNAPKPVDSCQNYAGEHASMFPTSRLELFDASTWNL